MNLRLRQVPQGLWGIFFVLGFLSFKAPFLFAEETLQIKNLPLNDLQGQSSLKQKTVLGNNNPMVKGALGFTGRYYQSSQAQFYREGAEDQQTEYTLGLRSEPGTRGGGFDIETKFQGGEGVNYFRPSEAYYKFDVGSSHLYFGRKLQPWSQADRLWHRGLFESRFMDDPLEAKPAGLTGLFWVFRQNNNEFMIFTSPLFIPEFGPQATVENNKLTSKNPWFRPPSDEILLNKSKVEMNYRIVTPDIEDVILHPSVGFHLQRQWQDWFFASSYAYKPMNQFLLEVPFVLNLTDVTSDVSIDADIVPRVEYQHVASLAMGKNSSIVHSWLEWNYEKPATEEYNYKHITQTMNETHIFTGTVETSENLSGFHGTKLWLSYSRLLGGDGKDYGEFAPDESLFERRFQFQNAFQLGVRRQFSGVFSRPLLVSSSVLYDISQNGGIFSLQGTYFLSQFWQCFFSVDLIGRMSNENSIDNGFTSLYRSNDRVSLGANYVF
ncbi:MAG: hypothetical protein KDD34_01015 [Bdellovibrionales bacterium]|nr:hypothetical protein [Bdellovibrionales bacterium]